MENAYKPFALAINFQGDKILIRAQQEYNPLNFVYRITMPNEQTFSILTYEPGDIGQTGWAIEGLGETDLAREIGAAIDDHNFEDQRIYMEPFMLEMAGLKYLINPEMDVHDETERFYYGVYKDGLFQCFIDKPDDEDHWSVKGSNAPFDTNLIQKIGEAIDEHYVQQYEIK